MRATSTPRSTCGLAVSAGMGHCSGRGPQGPYGGHRAVTRSAQVCCSAPRACTDSLGAKGIGAFTPTPYPDPAQLTGPQMRPLVGLPWRLVPSGQCPAGLWSEPEWVSAGTFPEEPPWHLCPWPYRLALGLTEPFAPQGQEAVGGVGGGVCV